jgi:AcrR family transcriptional regulator
MTASPSPAAVPDPGTRPRRRDQILTTAEELFATKGYTKTSMRDVATASGILAGSLYHHFESKEAIAVELLQNYYTDLGNTVRKFDSADADSLSVLRSFTAEVAQVSFRHPAALQIRMFDAPSTASSSLKTVIHAAPASLSRQWRTLIGRAVMDGAISPDIEPRLLRFVLYRVTTQAGLLGWAWQSTVGSREVTDCINTIIFDGLASGPPSDHDAGQAGTAIGAVNEASARWEADAGERLAGRRGGVLAAARDQFALRGFEATTMRDIADAAGLTASNLYRYFESKDSMLVEILGDFSDQLLTAYKEVIGAEASMTETLDAILWLLQRASYQFGPEIEMLQGFSRLVDLGLSQHYEQGARARLVLLAQLIETGVATGEFAYVAAPELVATCVREIMWSPMRDLASVSPLRARKFFRRTVLSGAAARH